MVSLAYRIGYFQAVSTCSAMGAAEYIYFTVKISGESCPMIRRQNSLG